LSVNTGTGLIAGTPTSTGTSTVTLSAANAGGTGTATLTLTVNVAAPVITSATVASVTVGSAFTYQIAATNTPTSYGATGLPAGLSVNTGTGLISGTPGAAGTSTVALSATNAAGTGTATLTLTIAAISAHFVQSVAQAAPGASSTLSLSFLANTNAGELILVGFDYDTNTTPTSVTDTQGNVFTPVGGQLTSPGGTRSQVYYAKNIEGGSDMVTVTLSGNSGWLEVYLTEYGGVDPNNPIDAQAGASGSAGAVSSGNATTTVGGDVIYGYCVGDWACTAGSGFTTRSNLNDNLIEDEVAAVAGSYAATGTANNGWTMQMVALKPASGGGGGTAAPVITSATTASGIVGSAFSYQITATNTPTSYGATGLPAGLSVSTGTGLISGTPTATGTSTVTLSASNASGTGTAILTVNITLTGPIVSFSPTSITFEVQGVGTTSAAQTVTLSNTGSGALSITSLVVTGPNPSDFAQTDNCGSSIGAGSNCTISVTFTPTMDGTRSATIAVADNATGSPQTVTLTGTGTGQFMVLSSDKTHLVNTITNTPVFMVAEQGFTLDGNLSDSDLETYLSDRVSRGFNLIWMSVADNVYSADPPYDSQGNLPFGGASFTDMQEPYFAHLDYVLGRMAAYGITALLGPAFAGSDCANDGGWAADIMAASDATMTAYGAYLGNRYKSYPNIIWMIGGDANFSCGGATLQARLNDIATGIKSVDSNHLMTAENIRGQSSLDVWSGYSWLDLNGLYNVPSDIPAAANANYTRSDFLPEFMMEDYCEGGHSMTALGVRTEGYWAVLSGAYLGRDFCNNAIWSFGDSYDTMGATWQSQLSSAGSVSQEWMGKLFSSREHWKMVPDINHTVVTAGYGSLGTWPQTTLTTTARSSDGQTIIAYIPNGNAATITVDMTKITSATNTAQCWWFNPSNGSTTLIGSFPNSGTQNFTPPDANDWVLVIDDANANLPAPGSSGS
jgi:hypothetical protein